MAKEVVKVGGIDYTIKTVKDLRNDADERLWGQIKYGRCEIRLNPRLKPQTRRQCLWHEILHAIFHQAGRVEEGADEGLVDMLAYAIHQVLQDNPRLREEL